MGLMEELAGAVEKHPAVNDQQHSSLVQEIWQRFGNASEGMKLMDTARSQSLGGAVESWMKGQYKPINADQAKGLVGEGWVKEIADRTGDTAGCGGGGGGKDIAAGGGEGVRNERYAGGVAGGQKATASDTKPIAAFKFDCTLMMTRSSLTQGKCMG
ncbi:MAG TPA: hypothetical protein VGS10_15145 [Terracidiphilus sp.]|nr:hypothetical protein [Terracidiphilus sp.]